MAKKRYAGLYFSSNAAKPDKIDKKGIESVRRDNCVLIRRILESVLKLILE
jgi:DNA polymerase delta subunit 1